MIKECIVISDANIFFDLLSVGLLEAFFALPFDIRTTEFVLEEISKEEQRNCISRFVERKKLTVVTFELEELFSIMRIMESCKNNASMPDCSVWYYAKKVDGLLLTGDKKLRHVAESDSVRVAGILHIFDKMLEHNILNLKEAIENLEALMKINCRLPRESCEERINKWRNSFM